MKIGCHVSGLQSARAAPYDEGVRNALELGFDAVELIAMTSEELASFYRPEKCRELRALCASQQVEISQFALYSPACQGLVSTDQSLRLQSLATVRRAIEVCAQLGTPLFNLVAHWPDGFECPHAYPPSYIHPVSRGLTEWPSSKMVGSLPEDWNYATEWDQYISSLNEIAEMAGDHGVKLALEGHAHVLVSGTDAMLRMFDRMREGQVVINFDTAWHLVQREFLPMSIFKLQDHIAHVHLRDGDGLLNYLVPVGEGIIDWNGVFDALKSIKYSGVISFEYVGFRNYLEVASASKSYVRGLLGHEET